MIQTILKLSIVGGLLAIILQCLKPLTRKVFSVKWQYYIWLVVLVSMIIPISIKLSLNSSKVLITPPTQTVQPDTLKTTEEAANQLQPETVIHNIPIENIRNEATPINSIEISDAAALFWYLGATVFLLFQITRYLIFWCKIKNISYGVDCPELEECKQSMKIKRKIELRITEGITTPLLVGIFCPIILMPNINMPSESLTYVLQHELTHYKRKDLVYKWFAMLVNAIHWFNPLVYLVVKNINEDCEISCDCAVTKGMESESKGEYMKTILSLLAYSTARGQALTTAMASDKNKIIRRFKMIQKVNKTRKIITMLSVMLTAVILVISVYTAV